MTYVSTQSLTTPLRQSVMQAQSALSNVETETSTGTLADIGLSLGAQTGTALSLSSQVDNLNSFTNSNNVVATRLSSTSSVLDSLVTSAQGLSAALVTAANSGGSTSSIQTTAQSALQSLIANLNTSVGGQYIFGGINTTNAPISNYFSTTTTPSAAKTAVDASFQSTFNTSQTSSAASSITGAAMTSYLDGTFDSLFTGSNWQQNWSSASSQTLQSTISPSQNVTTSVTANSTAFQQLAEASTMLTEFTGSNMSSDAQAAVVAKATSLVNTALASLTNIQGSVGVAQNAVTNANSQMSAQVGILQTNVSDLESVNTYDLSSQVSQLQTQLEASYELTSQLHQLSLTNYLTSTG